MNDKDIKLTIHIKNGDPLCMHFRYGDATYMMPIQHADDLLQPNVYHGNIDQNDAKELAKYLRRLKLP